MFRVRKEEIRIWRGPTICHVLGGLGGGGEEGEEEAKKHQ